MLRNRLRPAAAQSRRMYVQIMMQVVGRALQAISEVDDDVQREIALLPDGFIFEMTALPAGPALLVQKTGNHLRYLGETAEREADLSIRFKHIAHAFLVLSFQEKTAVAFANDRMVVNGDLGYALRVTRVLNRLEAFILPKLVAERAVKQYPQDLKLPEKLLQGARIYLQMGTNLVQQVTS